MRQAQEIGKQLRYRHVMVQERISAMAVFEFGLSPVARVLSSSGSSVSRSFWGLLSDFFLAVVGTVKPDLGSGLIPLCPWAAVGELGFT